MKLDDAIKAVELAAQDLKKAIVDLERAAEEEFKQTPPRAILALKQRAEEIALGPVRVAVAESRRPKGPTATLEFTGKGHGSVAVEVIRRTATQVLVRRSDWGQTDSFKLADGRSTKRGTIDYLGYWRIRESDLAAIRAMPEGENEVSRALKAISRGVGR